MVGNLSDLPGIVFPETAFLLCQLESIAATHALLQIVRAFLKSIGNYCHHVLVVAAHELVSSADEQLHVVDFGARLIEALAEVLQAEKDKVDCRCRGDAYDVTLFQLAGPAG